MKKITAFILTSLLFIFISSCKKSKIVTEDGLTQDIVNLVPGSILKEIKSLGMPINGGDNPPNIENSYIGSPFVLKASNISYDTPGYTYSDYYVKFYNQDNKKLTVSMDYKNGPEEGTGYGSYIVGDENSFSVFVGVKATEDGGSEAKLVHIISGNITSEGISNLYFANFMIDNYENPNGYWIEDGQGRVIYDSDGISPVITSFETVKSMKSGISEK